MSEGLKAIETGTRALNPDYSISKFYDNIQHSKRSSFAFLKAFGKVDQFGTNPDFCALNQEVMINLKTTLETIETFSEEDGLAEEVTILISEELTIPKIAYGIFELQNLVEVIKKSGGDRRMLFSDLMKKIVFLMSELRRLSAGSGFEPDVEEVFQNVYKQLGGAYYQYVYDQIVGHFSYLSDAPSSQYRVTISDDSKAQADAHNT